MDSVITGSDWAMDPVVGRVIAIRQALAKQDNDIQVEEILHTPMACGEAPANPIISVPECMLQSALETAVERIALLHGFDEISSSARYSLSAMVSTKLQNLCRQYAISHGRRVQKLETAFTSPLAHMLALNGLAGINDIQKYYDTAVRGELEKIEKKAIRKIGLEDGTGSDDDGERTTVVEKEKDKPKPRVYKDKFDANGQIIPRKKPGPKPKAVKIALEKAAALEKIRKLEMAKELDALKKPLLTKPVVRGGVRKAAGSDPVVVDGKKTKPPCRPKSAAREGARKSAGADPVIEDGPKAKKAKKDSSLESIDVGKKKKTKAESSSKHIPIKRKQFRHLVEATKKQTIDDLEELVRGSAEKATKFQSAAKASGQKRKKGGAGQVPRKLKIKRKK